ncbi:hypothetical protein [Roseivirga sp.]|uniref:hypothetical protein n=1 Tax=Roseivirga sp. TaxID=1964215 RepID=UPI003B8E8D62
MRHRLPLFLVKIIYYEYWPFWLFFMPLVPYWIYLAARAKSLTYFTAANPGIIHGGVFGESKIDILEKINPKYKPTTLFFEANTSLSDVVAGITNTGLTFPMIIKPDVGERGAEVEKLDSQLNLEHYITQNHQDFIIQEFVDFEIELGVLYHKLPISNTSNITSIVQKEFLGVTGDGVSTIRTLLAKSERAKLQMPVLEEKFGTHLNDVLPKGAYENLQPIGNHCLGTKFLSGQHLINDKLVSVFDEIAADVDGFNFGRFDLKVSSIEDLYAGRNIKILELNGVTSEPGHIYDPKYSLLQAYKDTMTSMKTSCLVSIENMKQGARVTPFWEMFRLLRTHFSSNELSQNQMNGTKTASAK